MQHVETATRTTAKAEKLIADLLACQTYIPVDELRREVGPDYDGAVERMLADGRAWQQVFPDGLAVLRSGPEPKE